MNNRNLIPIKTNIFRNKLSKILEKLQKNKDDIPLQTKEALVADAVKLLSLFYRTINTAQFKPSIIVPGTSPDYKNYNESFEAIKDDIDILFAELENLESVVVEQFNLMAAQSNRINSRVKRLSGKIKDYSLYSKLPIKNSLFFSDSFIDTSKVQSASPLLNATECNLNQAEGIVTLPINQTGTLIVSVTAPPVINSNSNGRTGNNEELNISQLNNNMQVILDNNPDTWFEYERVVKVDDGVSLLLDFTLNLTTEQVINYIRINPNNFGTKTEIEIEDITTSSDGSVYVSVKDEIPVQGFVVQDEANIFKLAPSTSKFAGQGIFTFTPRFVKYVKIILRQISPYLITTVQGQQFRYAIGLRDIEIKKVAFENAGEIVSSIFNADVEIKKVALRVSQRPDEGSELADIDHQVSFDDGNTWIGINPLEQNATLNLPAGAPEILNVNTEDENSISTSSAVTTLRYKAILKRNDDNFNEFSNTFAESITSTSELKSIPLSEPWSFSLSEKPIINSIAMLDTNFGSRGNLNVKYIIGQGTGGAVSFNLPWDNLDLDISKDSSDRIVLTNILRVFIGGEEWTRVPRLNAAASTATVFTLNPELTFSVFPAEDENGLSIVGGGFSTTDSNQSITQTVNGAPSGNITLSFGNGIFGKSPIQGSLIEIVFTDERLFPVKKSIHSSSIKFPTSIDQSVISLYRKGLILQNTVEISKESNIHRLLHRNIVIDEDHPIRFTNEDSVFNSMKTFRNGQASPTGELESAGDWSIDQTRGIIFSFTRSDNTPGTVSYYYQSQSELSPTDWTWGDDLSIHKSVTIKDSAWSPNKVVGFAVPSGLTKINLSNLSVVEGSVQFQGISSFDEEDNPFLREVPFINGFSELTTVIKTQEQIPVLTGAPVASFVTSVKMYTNTLFDISFSNITIFVTEVDNLGQVNSIGKYWVDRSTSTVHVHTNSETFTDTGKINYYTEDPSKITDGSYSINYELGEIFLQIPIPAAITLDYEYSEYYIRYNIAREVKSTDWTYDVVTNKIIVGPNETSIRSRIPNISGSNSVRPSTYQVNYNYIIKNRRNIADLKDYFTPVLKDYVLQVLTINS